MLKAVKPRLIIHIAFVMTALKYLFSPVNSSVAFGLCTFDIYFFNVVFDSLIRQLCLLCVNTANTLTLLCTRLHVCSRSHATLSIPFHIVEMESISHLNSQCMRMTDRLRDLSMINVIHTYFEFRSGI